MTNPLEENMVARTQSQIDTNKPAQALETAKDLSEADPKDAIVWHIKGKAHYLADQFEDALSCFSQAATIENARPETWLMMGLTLIALRRYEEAIPSLEYVKGTQPDNVHATIALCAIHTILGHVAEARAYAEQAKKADRKTAVLLLEGFQEDYFAKSNTVDAASKAMAERLLHNLKISGAD